MNRYEEQTSYDQIAVGVGSGCLQNRPEGPADLCLAFFQERIHSASTVRHAGLAAVFPDRLSRHGAIPDRLDRSAESAASAEGSSFYHAPKSRAAADKKRAFDRLQQRIFRLARRFKLIEKLPTASIDATGLETRYTSRYFVFRKGYRPFERYRWTKLTIVCHNASHLIAGAVVSGGPSQDSPEFPAAVRQAVQHIPVACLLGDAGYDGEHNHRLAREELGIAETVIALNKRRGTKWPKTPYRRQMKRSFPRETYRQRWQVESVISRHKRHLGLLLTARRLESQENECYLRVLTHNLMILRLSA